MCRNYPHGNGNVNQVHNIQETEIVGQMVRTIPRIYASLEDLQADHQSTVVEVERNIAKQSISVFIELGSTHSYYITPKIVEICAFKKLKHNNHG